MIFPKWTNNIPKIAPLVLGGVAVTIIFVFTYWFTDKHLVVGYQPVQPIQFSHRKHANDMGLDCRYCHFNVERSPVAGVPSTQVCMNCHTQIKTDSPEIQKLQKYHESGTPVPWVRIHKTPDYAYFDHSAHVNKGVSCVECHGRIDQMEEVHQAKSLTMGFCLDCHRDPAPRVREKKYVTRLGWTPDSNGWNSREYGQKVIEKYHINPRTDCSTCHR